MENDLVERRDADHLPTEALSSELAKDVNDPAKTCAGTSRRAQSRRRKVQSLSKPGRGMRDSTEPVTAVLRKRGVVSENTRRTRRDKSEEVNEAAEVN